MAAGTHSWPSRDTPYSSTRHGAIPQRTLSALLLRWAPRAAARHRQAESDPERGNMPLLMRTQVKRAVRRRLEDEGEGEGLSILVLVNELLTEWLSKCE